MSKTAKNILLIFIVFQSLSLSAKNYVLKSAILDIGIDSLSGGVQSIVNNKDKYGMNWILKSDGSQYPWQTAQYGWGMGLCKLNGDSVRWNSPVNRKIETNKIIFEYQLKDVLLILTHSITKDGTLTESFQFINNSSKAVSLSDMGICTPFNDNYPDSKTCVEARCNTHVWTGGNDSYVFAERMGGEAPHLGLVLNQGTLKSYEILNRSRNVYAWALSGSNVRGTIVLNPMDITLKPGKTYMLAWNVFPANDWNDFYAKAKTNGFVKASAFSYVVEKDEKLQATFESDRKLKKPNCFLNDKQVSFTQTGNKIEVSVATSEQGEQVVRMDYDNNRSTFVKLYRISDIDKLIAKRARFIVENQQMNDTADARYGAYMVYDNDTHKIYLNTDKRKSADLNEARERTGMGVFLAMYLQKHPDIMIQKSLERFCKYVHTKLQLPDYTVLDGLTSTRKRIYNYPWVAELYLEMFKLTHERTYLTDFYHTSRKYFKEGAYHFYGIGFPVQDGLAELKKAGWTNEYDSLLSDCRKTAENYINISLYYPKSEVNYEQSIVAPSVIFLLEMYQVTGEKKFLNEGEKQLKALETFAGKQPDFHLNEIGIRHWDGYWFGKRQFWGDTMPHYWSTITAEAFARYAEISGNNEYQKRAETIVKNNLPLFFANGSASCAYVYPAKINGQKAAFFDPFANDQDWALVFYEKCLRLNK